MTDLKAKLNSLLNRQSIIHFRFRSGYDYRDLAVFGFEILNKDAAPAVPGLIVLLTNEHNIARNDVIYALANIGPEAKAAVPYLLARLKDEEGSILDDFKLERLDGEGMRTLSAVNYALSKIDPDAAAKAGAR